MFIIEEHSRYQKITFQGVPNEADAEAAIEQLAKLGQRKSRMWVLPDGFDLSAVELMNVAFSRMQKVKDLAKTAMVIVGDLPEEASRVHRTYMEITGEQGKIFQSEAEAEKWLLSDV